MVMLQPSVAEPYLGHPDTTSSPVYLTTLVEQVAQWQEHLRALWCIPQVPLNPFPKLVCILLPLSSEGQAAKPGNFKTKKILSGIRGALNRRLLQYLFFMCQSVK